MEYTEAVIRYIKRNLGKKTYREMGAHLGVDEKTLMMKVTRMRKKGVKLKSARDKAVGAVSIRYSKGRKPRHFEKQADGKWKEVTPKTVRVDKEKKPRVRKARVNGASVKPPGRPYDFSICHPLRPHPFGFGGAVSSSIEEESRKASTKTNHMSGLTQKLTIPNHLNKKDRKNSSIYRQRSTEDKTKGKARVVIVELKNLEVWYDPNKIMPDGKKQTAEHVKARHLAAHAERLAALRGGAAFGIMAVKR